MAENRYYASREQLEDMLREAEEAGGGPEYDCGGQTLDGPPCGGCTRCFRMMAQVHWAEECKRVQVLQQAGFEVADPSVIDTHAMCYGGEVPSPDATYADHEVAYVGLGLSHDAYDCWCAGEVTEIRRPWEVPNAAST